MFALVFALAFALGELEEELDVEAALEPGGVDWRDAISWRGAFGRRMPLISGDSEGEMRGMEKEEIRGELVNEDESAPEMDDPVDE